MLMRLDYNNKIEAVSHAYVNNIRKTECKKYQPSQNEAMEIQKLFKIDEFSMYLDNMKSIINSVLKYTSNKNKLPEPKFK